MDHESEGVVDGGPPTDQVCVCGTGIVKWNPEDTFGTCPDCGATYDNHNEKEGEIRIGEYLFTPTELNNTGWTARRIDAKPCDVSVTDYAPMLLSHIIAQNQERDELKCKHSDSVDAVQKHYQAKCALLEPVKQSADYIPINEVLAIEERVIGRDAITEPHKGVDDLQWCVDHIREITIERDGFRSSALELHAAGTELWELVEPVVEAAIEFKATRRSEHLQVLINATGDYTDAAQDEKVDEDG